MKIKHLTKVYIGPTMIVAIIVGLIGIIAYRIKYNELRDTLEYTINNRILEGENEIGAVAAGNILTGKDIRLRVNPTKDFDISDKMYSKMCFGIPQVSSWNGTMTIQEDYVATQCTDTRQSEYFSMINSHAPEVIILKKEDDKYTLYGEQIVAVAISKLGAPFLVQEKQGLLNLQEYSIDFENIKLNLFSHIMDKKYPNCKFQNERYYSNQYSRGIYITPKHQEFDSLQVKSFTVGSNRPYYHVNEYFELHLDDQLKETGRSPITTSINSFGNNLYTVYYRTYTSHFIIKETSGSFTILKREYLSMYGIITVIAMIVSLILCHLHANKKSYVKRL